MKVILQKDIKGLGRKFDIKEIQNGYATHLIRSQAVKIATTGEIAHIDNVKTRKEEVKEAEYDSIKKIIEQLVADTVTIKAKSNDQGHLFEGITLEKILDIIKGKYGELPAGVVTLESPIKEIGEHTLKLMYDNSAVEVAVFVVSEDA